MPSRNKAALKGGLEEIPWGRPESRTAQRFATNRRKKKSHATFLENRSKITQTGMRNATRGGACARDKAASRAYSFGEPVDSCHYVGLARRREPGRPVDKSPPRRARRWSVNYYDRINYIVITTIWRRERKREWERGDRPFSRHRQTSSNVSTSAFSSISYFPDEDRSGLRSPRSANSPFAIERRRSS